MSKKVKKNELKDSWTKFWTNYYLKKYGKAKSLEEIVELSKKNQSKGVKKSGTNSSS